MNYDNVFIPGSVRIEYLEALNSRITHKRARAAELLRQYPGLDPTKRSGDLLLQYPRGRTNRALFQEDSTLTPEETARMQIDRMLASRGWKNTFIDREKRIRSSLDGTQMRLDYVLHMKIKIDLPPIIMAVIEAKHIRLPPAHGLEQAKRYADHYPLNKQTLIPFVFSTNGSEFVQLDRLTGKMSTPRSISKFPPPKSLIQYVPQEFIDLLSKAD
jgi:hypothetical protein